MTSLVGFRIDYSIAKFVEIDHAVRAFAALEEVVIVHDGTAFLRQLNLLEHLAFGQYDAVDECHLLCGVKANLRLADRLKQFLFQYGRLLPSFQVVDLMLQYLFGEAEVIGGNRLLGRYGIGRLLHSFPFALGCDRNGEQQSDEYDN